jgi:hypothetical protein
MIRNKGWFKINSQLNKCNTRVNCNLFQPMTDLKKLYAFFWVIQMPRNHPEESIQHSEHDESLKSRINLKMCHKGPCYSGTEVYNNLPLEIRRLSDNVETCKKLLRKFLLKQPFFLRWLNILVIKPTGFNHRNVF